MGPIGDIDSPMGSLWGLSGHMEPYGEHTGSTGPIGHHMGSTQGAHTSSRDYVDTPGCTRSPIGRAKSPIGTSVGNTSPYREHSRIL